MTNITQSLINAARTRSIQEGSRLIETLQEMAELSNAELVGQLAALFHCPAINMAQLHELQPSFDVVAYQDAVKHGCVAVRDGTGTLLFVFADPFDAGLRAWAQGVVTQAVAWRLAHYADLSAYLALQEDQVRDSPNKSSASCSAVPKGECDQQVFEQCVQRHVDNRGASGDNYNYLFANCGQWAEDVISQCRQECVKK